MNAFRKQNIPNMLARLTELNMQHSLVTKKKSFTLIYPYAAHTSSLYFGLSKIRRLQINTGCHQYQ